MQLPKTILSPQNIQRLSTAIPAASLLWFVAVSLHWPLTGDASLMHYIVFLMDHGLAPYRDIADMNLPGAYLPNWLVLHTLGPGALAWRCYDLALLLLSGAAIIKLTHPASRHSGFWAAALFALIHGRDGLLQLGQRDLTLATLLLLGTAALLHRPQSNSLWRLLAFGTCVGLATTIKPTALPFLLLAMPTLQSVYRADQPILHKVGAILSGLTLPLALTVVWLAHHHTLTAFLHTEQTLAPFHASLGRRSLGYLLLHSFSPILPLAATAVLLCVLARSKSPSSTHALPTRTLQIATTLGLLSYILQGKGYPYHRYVFLAFLLPLIAANLDNLTRRKDAFRWAGTLVLFAGSLLIALPSAIAIRHYSGREDAFRTTLKSDLLQMAAISGEAIARVQCLDTISGCVATLNDLHLTQATGTLYDEFLFHPAGSVAVDESRERFRQAIETQPPTLFVVTEPLFPDGPNGYAKLDQWPEFAAWLAAHYTLALERPAMPLTRTGGAPYHPPGYRIYLQRSR